MIEKISPLGFPETKTIVEKINEIIEVMSEQNRNIALAMQYALSVPKNIAKEMIKQEKPVLPKNLSFKEAAHYLKFGNKLKRDSWEDCYIYLAGIFNNDIVFGSNDPERDVKGLSMQISDFEANDWMMCT